MMEQQPGAYHVFLNHRGPDLKKSLASLIYNRLTNCHGLRVFLDKDEIRTGDTISNAIHTAIQSAYVHITFFSERYAESWWCLEELYWILRSYHKHNRKVIPVFCGVQPADLRHIESGCYKNAFDQHQSKGRVSTEEITKWKKTLSEAADISGIFFKPNESDYGEILEDIVRKVLEEVFKWGSLYVAKCPVGLDHVAEHPLINKILKQSDVSDTMIVGIAGMSGIGKTTLAKYLYNLRRLSFNGKSCFLSNVRTKDLAKLQGKLLSDLLGYTQDLQDIDGIGKHLLRHCRILLVLDDVDHIDQIDGLIDIDSVGCGSLILITARDRGLLSRSSANTLLYNVMPLNRLHARELFCQHAFRESKASEEFEDLVEKFLEICKGFPLALKVLGAHFVGKSDKDYWKRQLKRFSTTLHEDILQTLKVSYDALNGEDKEAFLDIGCFLVGEETELAIRVLEGLYGSNIVHSLERLHQKCLVDFHYDVQSDDEIECRKPEDPMIGDDDPSVKYRGYKLAMHDHLRELARHIARQEFPVLPTLKPLRVGSTNDIVELSKSHGVSHLPMRGIRTSKDERLSDFVGFRGECVHLFVLEFPVDLSSLLVSLKLSAELVWLRLRNFRFGSVRSHLFIRLPKLSVLELQCHRDNIEQFFQNFDLTSMDHNFSKNSAPGVRLPNFMLSGKVDDEMDEGQIRQNMFELNSIFHFRTVRFTKSPGRTREGFWLQCPIAVRYDSKYVILWFITNDVGGYSIRVAFEEGCAAGRRSPSWISQGRESGGRRLHVFMWSPCFNENLKLAPHLQNFRNLWLAPHFRTTGNLVLKIPCDASGSELQQVLVEGLWVLTPVSMLDVLEVSNKIITKFANESSWSVASPSSG